jgi:hypothetical protein
MFPPGRVRLATNPLPPNHSPCFRSSDYNPVIADFDGVLPTTSVKEVVDSANRTGSSCSPHPNAVAAFCWESGDNTTTDWYPQGITTSADASANGQYEGKTVVLASWYYSGSGNNKGARLSFAYKSLFLLS